MANRLAVSVDEKDNVSVVTLSGVIDEDNELSEITARIQKPLVAINTAGVERINSCGVRDWVTWLGEMEKRGKNIFLLECPPVIMAQVNLVHNFVGSGTIINFFGPYFCSRCDTDRMLLIDVQEALASLPFKAPVCRCDACDLTMEFDDIESSYFSFLGQLKDRPIEAAVLEKVKKLTTAGTEAAVRGRNVSIPIPTMTPSSNPSKTTPTGGSGTASSPFYNPTLPSGRQYPGLLSPVDGEPADRPTSSGANKILYLVIGLLALAIALLGVVVLKIR